jgi:hypothetical protein
MSAPKTFKQGNRVALAADTSIRGVVAMIEHPYNVGDPEAYRVDWDKHGQYLYFAEMLVLEKDLIKK